MILYNTNIIFIDIFVEKIERDTEFWMNKMENKIIDFYKNVMLEEIVNPKIYQ
jgi:hypothetical protein